MNDTTIQVDKSTVKSLKEIKEHPKQSYNDLIRKMIKIFKKEKKKKHYDEFISIIQQEKMKELWDNEEDEVWENA